MNNNYKKPIDVLTNFINDNLEILELKNLVTCCNLLSEERDHENFLIGKLLEMKHRDIPEIQKYIIPPNNIN